MRTETVINDAVHIFPYGKVKQGEDVVLYGFGKVGKDYYWQIRANKYCNIKYIVDQNWEKYSLIGFPVKNPESIKNDDKVRIVIALANKSKQVLELLRSFGVDDNRIIYGDAVMEKPIYAKGMHFIDTIMMTEQEALEQYGVETYANMQRVRKLLRLGGVDKDFVRVGAPNDGGYVMVDDLDGQEDKIAYSFGINNDVSWDTDMADKGYEIYMYDHTIDCLPEERNAFHFFKKGIADYSRNEEKLETLECIILQNGHQNKQHMILKMDVEGAEWDFLNNVRYETLDQFDQIVLELHYMLDTNGINTKESALKRLNRSHRLAHIHANNNGDVAYIEEIPYPDTLEATFVKRDKYKECAYNGVLPAECDSPCWRAFPEIILGKWNI